MDLGKQTGLNAKVLALVPCTSQPFFESCFDVRIP